MKSFSLPIEYPDLDFTQMKIYLIEGTGKLLGNMSASSSHHAKGYLEVMGVTVITNTFVNEYDGEVVLLSDGSSIESSLVIWAAGVKGRVPAGLDARHVNKMNQLKTDTFNKVIGTENIFALGDIACIETELYPKGYPQMASVAIDQAKNLANNFMSLANEDELMPFQYINKGSMATVGRNKAVVDLAKPAFSFHGFFAWVVWMSLHLFLLIGFKNKLQVFVNWVYKYVTRHQSLSIFFEPIAGMKNERFKRPKKDNN
jgi:NADH dehydrogenase